MNSSFLELSHGMPEQPMLDFLESTLSILEQQDDLSPRNPIVNQSLTRLVNVLVERKDFEFSADLYQKYIERFPTLCGKAEGLMEKYWAQHFIENDTLNFEDLKTFWYYKNYEKLWQNETVLLKETKSHRLVFLGAGALPMTAFMAAKNADFEEIICVDCDEEAISLSQNLMDKLGLEDCVKTVCGDAAGFAFKPDDFVFCASLIDNKQDVYTAMHRAGVTHFCVRDAEDIFEILYKKAETPAEDIYEFCDKTKPCPICINTTRLYRMV